MSQAPHLLDHPLARHHLGVIRNKETPSSIFRQSVRALTHLLIYEATRGLPMQAGSVETPLTTAEVQRLAGRIGVVPILRAGLGMVDSVLELLPEAEIWHLGFYRDETSLEPVPYYQKLPPGAPVDFAIVLDPMLATGGSAIAALETLRKWGVKQTVFMALLAAPEGVKALQQAHPETEIYLGCVDSHLNDQAYIVPGLGDAGDRIFNAAAE